MPSDYPSTDVPFADYRLPDLHDPVVNGPGFEGMAEAAEVYGLIAARLNTAASDLRAVLGRAQAAHEGEAAEASRVLIGKVAAVGEAGAAQAELAKIALREQVSYFARVRLDMQAAAAAHAAVPEMTQQRALGAGIPQHQKDLEAARMIAVNGADLYQTNTNHNLGAVFQSFDPPPESGLDVSTAPAPQAAAWPGGGSVTPAALGAAGAAPNPGSPSAGPLPPGPSTAGPGLGGPAGSVDLPGGGAGGTGPPAGPGTGPGQVGVGAGAAGRTGAGTSPGAPGTGGSVPRIAPSASAPEGSVPSSRTPFLPSATPASRLPSEAGTVGGGSAGGPGWVPGQPWTTRPGAPGGSPPGSGPEQGPKSDPRTTGGRQPVPGEPAPTGSTSSRPTATGHGMPLMAGGAGGRDQETEHQRPSWLVLDDPDGFWLSGLPPHGPAVIEAEEPYQEG